MREFACFAEGLSQAETEEPVVNRIRELHRGYIDGGSLRVRSAVGAGFREGAHSQGNPQGFSSRDLYLDLYIQYQ